MFSKRAISVCLLISLLSSVSVFVVGVAFFDSLSDPDSALMRFLSTVLKFIFVISLFLSWYFGFSWIASRVWMHVAGLYRKERAEEAYMFLRLFLAREVRKEWESHDQTSRS